MRPVARTVISGAAWVAAVSSVRSVSAIRFPAALFATFGPSPKSAMVSTAVPAGGALLPCWVLTNQKISATIIARIRVPTITVPTSIQGLRRGTTMSSCMIIQSLLSTTGPLIRRCGLSGSGASAGTMSASPRRRTVRRRDEQVLIVEAVRLHLGIFAPFRREIVAAGLLHPALADLGQTALPVGIRGEVGGGRHGGGGRAAP